MKQTIKYPALIRCTTPRGKENQFFLGRISTEVDIPEISFEETKLVYDSVECVLRQFNGKLYRKLANDDHGIDFEQAFSKQALHGFPSPPQMTVQEWYSFLVGIRGSDTDGGQSLFPRFDYNRHHELGSRVTFRNTIDFDPAALKSFSTDDYETSYRIADAHNSKLMLVSGSLYVETPPPSISVETFQTWSGEKGWKTNVRMKPEFLPFTPKEHFGLSFPLSKLDEAWNFATGLFASISNRGGTFYADPSDITEITSFYRTDITDFDFDHHDHQVWMFATTMIANIVRKSYQINFHRNYKGKDVEIAATDIAQASLLEDRLLKGNPLLGCHEDYGNEIDDLHDLWVRFRKPTYHEITMPQASVIPFLREHIANNIDYLPITLANNHRPVRGR